MGEIFAEEVDGVAVDGLGYFGHREDMKFLVPVFDDGIFDTWDFDGRWRREGFDMFLCRVPAAQEVLEAGAELVPCSLILAGCVGVSDHAELAGLDGPEVEFWCSAVLRFAVFD